MKVSVSPAHPFASERGPKCVVPFVFQNKTHWDCTSAGHSVPWCATSVNADKTVKQRQLCTTGWCEFETIS